MALNEFTIALKVCCFDDDVPLSVIVVTNDPQEQNHLGRLVRNFEHDLLEKNANSTSYKATLRNSTRTRRCTSHVPATAALSKEAPAVTCWAPPLALMTVAPLLPIFGMDKIYWVGP